jgi:tetratricopeptide (TPR) repeat protein
MMTHRACHLAVCAAVVGALALLAGPPRAAAQAPEIPDCPDPFKNGVGPFDYTNGADLTDPQHIPIVEQFHFTRRVESLQGGSTGAYALTDLDYTLRAIPNHHRALNAVVRYDLAHNGTPSQFRPVQCWFDRAFAFKPNDGMVWMIFGNWKSGKNDTKAALEAYLKAKELLPDSVEVDYNLGLLYVRLGDYDKAMACARTVYAANYPLQGLRKRLAEKGHNLDSP